MAQLVARLVRIEEVRGSNPLRSTNDLRLRANARGRKSLIRLSDSGRRRCAATPTESPEVHRRVTGLSRQKAPARPVQTEITSPVISPSTASTYASATTEAGTGENPGKLAWYPGASTSTFGLIALMRRPRGR